MRQVTQIQEMFNKILKNATLLMISFIITFQAFADRQREHKNYIKIKPKISCYNKQLTWYVGKSNGKFVQISIDIEESEKISIYVDDSLYYRDSISETDLEYAGFKKHFGMRLSHKKPKRIYLYLEKSKTYYSLPYKSRYSYIRIYHRSLDQFPSAIEYSNNAPIGG